MNIKDIILKTFYFTGSLLPFRLFSSMFRGNLGILTYHRVVPEEDLAFDTPGIAVSIDRFESQMKHISQNYLPVSIEKLSHYQNGRQKSSRLPLVISFDDGYKDNLTNALPILRKYSIPAVIYIATDFPDGKVKMWWYELFDRIKSTESVRFSYQGSDYSFDTAGEEQKKAAYKQISTILHSCDGEGQETILSQIGTINQINHSSHCLSWDEIRQLSEDPLITIGAHTISHPNLKMQEEDDALAQIKGSKERIEKEIGKPVEHFAYPFGKQNAVSTREYGLARKAGYKTAVTLLSSPITGLCDMMALPRHSVSRYHTPGMLDVKLSGWNNLWHRQE